MFNIISAGLQKIQGSIIKGCCCLVLATVLVFFRCPELQSVENPVFQNCPDTGDTDTGDTIITEEKRNEKQNKEAKITEGNSIVDIEQLSYWYMGGKKDYSFRAESELVVESCAAERRYQPTEKEMEFLARAVYSEARGECFDGQVAVAAVILNRLENPEFPDSIKEVIFQPRAFTAVDDGQFWLEPDENSYRAVKEALKGLDPSSGALYYYNPQTATSGWIFSRRVVIVIGRHSFAV